MRRPVVIAIVALGLATAGVGVAESGTPSPNVRGTLVRGPVVPVCVEGRACDAPAPGVVLVFSRNGDEVERVRTGAAGHFALRLPAGAYGVRTVRRNLLGSGLTPSRFRVTAKGVTTLRLSLDTGIRVPLAP